MWTDNTISARDAVSLGAKILTDHLVLFTDLSESVASKSTVVEKAESVKEKVLEMSIEGNGFVVSEALTASSVLILTR